MLADLTYRMLQSKQVQPALQGVGLGILPAILGVLGAVGQVGTSLASPFLEEASKGEQRVVDAAARTSIAQELQVRAQQKALRNQQLALVGAGLLVIGGVGYFFYRRRSRSTTKKRGRK